MLLFTSVGCLCRIHSICFSYFMESSTTYLLSPHKCQFYNTALSMPRAAHEVQCHNSRNVLSHKLRNQMHLSELSSSVKSAASLLIDQEILNLVKKFTLDDVWHSSSSPRGDCCNKVIDRYVFYALFSDYFFAVRFQLVLPTAFYEPCPQQFL